MIGNLIDRLLVKLVRDPARSRLLRRRFARRHGMTIGLYTIGAFDRWRLSAGTEFGRYCSIAASARVVDANHPIDALSTHPLFYLKRFGMVTRDAVHAEPTIIEDDVWLGHGAIVTPGCKRVGRGAVIGAGAIVLRDVPPYAVMAGSPARAIRFRFEPAVIEAIEATRWWELDADALGAALAKAPGFAEAPSVAGAQAFLAAIGCPPFVPQVRDDIADAMLDADTLVGLIRRERPDFGPGDLDRPFDALGLDSFGLINLRILIEQALGRQIDDRRWGGMTRPADMLGRVAAVAPAAVPSTDISTGASASPGQRRDYTLNMPQMALRGLGESWLFKEIGDIHWGNITRGLATSSAKIADDTGSRLYATFTRFHFRSTMPLSAYRENDAFAIDMAATRLGAGIFFGDARLTAPDGGLEASVMTSFSKFGESGANTSLLKGQPPIPPGCPILALGEMPAFGQTYRTQRAAIQPPALFETEYELQPPHDVNGVGLLYFAAYPMIVELCTLRHAGRAFATHTSTRMRDVFYFANCSPDETLLFRIHRWEEVDGVVSFDSTISRKSDDVTMAFIATEKVRIG